MIDRMIICQISGITIYQDTTGIRDRCSRTCTQFCTALTFYNGCSSCHRKLFRESLLNIFLFKGVYTGLLFNRECVHALCLYDSGERDPCAKHQGDRT